MSKKRKPIPPATVLIYIQHRVSISGLKNCLFYIFPIFNTHSQGDTIPHTRNNTMPKALEANDGIQQQQPPPHTEYMIMSVQANQIQTRYSILAGLFAWITLAGFITLPNTFTTIQTSNSLSGNEGGKMVQETVRNLQLLPFAGIICFIGIIGTCSLWRKKECRENYIWLIGHLFL